MSGPILDIQTLPDDLEIIMAFQENLSIIDNYLSIHNNDTSIINYEKLFLNDNQTFENNIDRYMDYISKNYNNTQLWNVLPTTLNNDELTEFMEQFLDCVNEMDFNIQNYVNILTKLLLPLDINNINENLKTNIFHMLTISINIDNWENEILVSYMFLHEVNLLDNFIDWSMVTENKYIKKMNVDTSAPYMAEPKSIYITNIIGILLNAWSFVDLANDDAIKPLYIMNKNCPIRWFDKKYNNTNVNMRTKLFFSILNALRVGIIPTFYRYDIYKGDVDILNSQLVIQTSPFVKRLLTNKRDLMQKYLDESIVIVNINSLTNLINSFYNTTYDILKLMKSEYNMIIDDIFNGMSFYMSFRKSMLLEIDNGFCEFIVDILHSNNLTNSISIKYDFIEIVYSLLQSNKLEINIISKFAESLIILHNHVHQTDMTLDQKIKKKLMIYSCINDTLTLKNIKFNEIIVDMMTKNINASKKMLHIILVGLCDINDEIVDMYKEIKRSAYNKLKLEETLYAILNTFYLKILSFLSTILSVIYNNEDLMKILLSTEIFSSFVTIINQNVNYLGSVIEYKSNMNFVAFKTANLSIESYVGYIINILNIVNITSDMTDFKHDYIFNVENYNKLQKYINNLQYDHIFDKIKCEDVTEEIDYPDEFLDPLTYSKINEPCLIPNMNGFEDLYFDKSTILKQLLIKEENPYTRAPLTLDEFENYNKLEEIELKNKTFKEKMMNYK